MDACMQGTYFNAWALCICYLHRKNLGTVGYPWSSGGEMFHSFAMHTWLLGCVLYEMTEGELPGLTDCESIEI